ncbi:ComF family protein [Pedobacter sp. MW01-1-1]|uniref:ComF family protein n=1 Tax=Pedobacter sp. MW01-1-1 TaxID=3383027 RepID=UPI003FEFDA12
MVLIKKWFSDLVALLFPNLCNGCGQSLVNGEHLICLSCLHDLPFTDYHLFAENKVAKQFWGRVPVQAAMAMLYFRKGSRVQNLVHRLKYHNKTDVGLLLGQLLGERLLRSPLFNEIDFIFPVPLHPSRLRKRGYNQCSFIAEGISSVLHVPFMESVLVRDVATESQTKKGRYIRHENMQAVFTVKDVEAIAGKHVLLIDDVITTGATLEACAEVLFRNGAKELSIATLAFAE